VATRRGSLDRHGFIDKRRLQKIDPWRMEPILHYDIERIRALLEQNKLSQTVLASELNTSAFTLRKWAIGETHLSCQLLRLLNLFDRKGLVALL